MPLMCVLRVRDSVVEGGARAGGEKEERERRERYRETYREPAAKANPHAHMWPCCKLHLVLAATLTSTSMCPRLTMSQ